MQPLVSAACVLCFDSIVCLSHWSHIQHQSSDISTLSLEAVMAATQDLTFLPLSTVAHLLNKNYWNSYTFSVVLLRSIVVWTGVLPHKHDRWPYGFPLPIEYKGSTMTASLQDSSLYDKMNYQWIYNLKIKSGFYLFLLYLAKDWVQSVTQWDTS